MREHHARALEQAKKRLLELEPGLLAIILGGSIAKGIDRDESDVDVIVVVPEERYLKRLEERSLSFLWYDIPGYEGELVEGRFVTRHFLVEAGIRGSEPTRYSFLGAYPVYCIDPEIPGLLSLIPVYPEDRHKEHVAAFFAQFQCNRTYYWDQGKRSRFLQLRAATEMVRFGCRLVLAHNRILYPCLRRLVEAALAAPLKPEKLGEKMDVFLEKLTDETKEDFCRMIEEFADWGKEDRYIQDVEMSWYNKVHEVGEW